MENEKISLQKIGKHIAEVRKEKGFTQKSLSDALFIGDKTISKWERGIIAPDITILKKLADILDISLEELLCGEKIMPEENKENVTISAIKIYSNETKRKLLKLVIPFIFILFFVFFTFFFVNKYYKWDNKNINVDGEFQVYGDVFSNTNKTKIVINKIIFDDRNAGTIEEVKTNYLKISIYSNNDELCSNHNNYSEDTPLSSLFENYSLVCNLSNKVDVDSLSISFEYYDKNSDNELVHKKILLK